MEVAVPVPEEALGWENPPADNNAAAHQQQQAAGEENGGDNNVLDGGVAVSEGSSRRPSSPNIDLVLYLECVEELDWIPPGHPVLKEGVTVSISLDKATTLGAVFTRYCDFCNERSQGKYGTVETSDLEFVHCGLLNPSDTAEASALMKNDRIGVRRVRTEERSAAEEMNRMQRENDREYFRKLRELLPEFSRTSCDVNFVCKGKLVDENGLNQEVLMNSVLGHAALLSKRNRWLGLMIHCARDNLKREETVSETAADSSENAAEAGSSNKAEHRREAIIGEGLPGVARIAPNVSVAEDDDDGIKALPFPVDGGANDDEPRAEVYEAAAEIENDEDDSNIVSSAHRVVSEGVANDSVDGFDRVSSPILSSDASSRTLLEVTLDHPPEAVKLLLEYCYTNRVICLGQEAFVRSCKTKGTHSGSHSGPVAPYPSNSTSGRGWPNGCLPTISFGVALAGIGLAEEASIPRLSLMCEVAASQLVSKSTVVEALGMCTMQQERTGNALPILRKAAMNVMLRHGQRGVSELCRGATFQRALEERSKTVVPSLLVGTMEAVPNNNSKVNSRKRDSAVLTKNYFDNLDKEDSFARETERRKRRLERWKGGDGESMEMEETSDFARESYATLLASETAKNLKRMSNHFGFNGFRSRRRDTRRV